jgi:hypothetical protein
MAAKWEKLSSFAACIYMDLLSGCAARARNYICSNASRAQKFSLSANKLWQDNVTDVYWTLNMLTVEQKSVKYV